jgi:hypothetical protein
MDQVEMLLRIKSTNDLRMFVQKIATRIPKEMQEEFISLLENKTVTISKKSSNQFNIQMVLNRIQELVNSVEEYEIEAFYRQHWRDDSFELKNDDGFCDEFYFCYQGAVSILEQGLYKEANEAFGMLDEIICRFDQYNDMNDYGSICFNELVAAGEIEVDMTKFNTLHGYCMLMSDPNNEDIYEAIYDFIGINSKPTFNDLFNACNVPVPNQDAIIDKWISFLYTKTSNRASELLKDVAKISGKSKIELIEKRMEMLKEKTCEDYLSLCDLYKSSGKKYQDKIIPTALEGLKASDKSMYKYADLASFLANYSEKAGDEEAYRFALMECFYVSTTLLNYLAVLDLDDEDLKHKALNYLDDYQDKKPEDYYLIHFINNDYDMVFDAMINDVSTLGMVGHKYYSKLNLKNQLSPLYLGLLSGFDSQNYAITRCVCHVFKANRINTCGYISEKMIPISSEQDKLWYQWCESEIVKSVDSIVEHKNRDSYELASWLLVALCELKQHRKENAPFEIIKTFLNKYSRHTGFKKEMRVILEEVKIEL